MLPPCVLKELKDLLRECRQKIATEKAEMGLLGLILHKTKTDVKVYSALITLREEKQETIPLFWQRDLYESNLKLRYFEDKLTECSERLIQFSDILRELLATKLRYIELASDWVSELSDSDHLSEV